MAVHARYGMVVLIVAVFAAATQAESAATGLSANDEILAAFERSGGHAYWIDQDQKIELIVQRHGRKENRAPLTPLLKMKGVKRVVLHGVDFSNTDVEVLSRWTELEDVLLNGKITDEGLKPLAKLTHLKKLFLWEMEINGTGLIHLKDLPELEMLSLSNLPLQSRNLDHVKQLKKLKKLHVSGCDINSDTMNALAAELKNIEVDF